MIINIKDLTIHKGNKVIISNLSLSMGHLETLHIYGESGIGKSTLALYIANLLDSHIKATAKISILPNPKNIAIALDSAVSLNPMMKVSKQILESIEQDKDKHINHILEFIKGHNIPLNKNDLNKIPSSLSGGQKAYINLIMTLMQKRPLLILDEITANMDQKNIENVYKILSEYKGSIINITHNKKYIDQLPGRVMNLSSYIQAIEPEIRKPILHKKDGSNILEVHNIEIFNKNTHIIKRLSFNVKYGSILRITGDLGSGKTTLVRAIALNKGYKGKIINRGKVSMLFQNYLETLNVHQSNLNNIITLTKDRGLYKNKLKHIKEILQLSKKFNISLDLLRGYPSSLSSGQAQRIGLIVSLICKPSLLILDEPSSNLGVDNVESLANIITDFTNAGNSCLLISHDIRLINRLQFLEISLKGEYKN